MHFAAHLPCQLSCTRRVTVGNRNEAHARMLRGKPCTQRADSARTDDCEAYVFSLKSDDALLPSSTRNTMLQSILAPASLMTRAHFTISLLM